MTIDTNTMISITEASQNFSKVTKVVDEHGTAVILKKLHASLIKATGGIDGIRDEGMLDLALNNPFQSFGEKELYPSIQAKAARLCFGLVKNHAMSDGNKRLGAHTMLVFLSLNGYELSYSQKELSDVILALASGNIGEKEILQWIIEHQQ